MIRADADHCPGADCQAFDANLLLQSMAETATNYTEDVGPPAKSSEKERPHASKKSSKKEGDCPNLVMFMDGTLNELNKACDWLPEQSCESNIAVMWRLADEIAVSSQKAYYETGVASSGTPDDDSGISGVGTKRHAENVYKWLTENYEGCNKLYMFGFSRGTLSLRMLQGMIHRVGIAKAGFHAEAAHANFHGDDGVAAAFKASDQAFSETAEIEFVGLFDAVLRTLLHPLKHRDPASFHMKMTSSVKQMAHAIALSEHREIFQANELYTDSVTTAEQVWFAGTHSDVGGGFPARGASRIAAGWMLDKAVEAGLMLPPNWEARETMAVDYLDDVSSESGLDFLGTKMAGVNVERALSLATVRNPAKCRTQAGFSGELKYHQSVQDRMTANKGWVPLPECCAAVKSEADGFGIQYVTNDHYDARKPAIGSSPHWLKISIGKLQNAPPKEYVSNPDYYLKVFSWHSASSVALPASKGAGQGCCTSVEEFPTRSPTWKNTGSYWWPNYKYDLDFTGTTVVIPYEASVADMFVVEVFEDDVFSDDYVGRTKVLFSSLPSTKRTFDIGDGATIEVTVETMDNDEDAVALLGGGPAACQWLDLQSGMSRQDMCASVSSFVMTAGNLGNAKTCKGFIEDITTGSLIEMHGHH